MAFEQKRCEGDVEIAKNTKQIESKQAALNGIYQELESLGEKMNQVGHQRDHHITRSQELIQVVASGRRNFDEVGKRAVSESADADHTGSGMEAKTENNIRTDQEHNVHYAHRTHDFLSGAPTPPTLAEHQQRQRKEPTKGRQT